MGRDLPVRVRRAALDREKTAHQGLCPNGSLTGRLVNGGCTDLTVALWNGAREAEMAEDRDDDIDDEDAEGGEDGGAKKKGGLPKLALFIGLPVVILLLAGTAGALLFLGGGDEAELADAAHGGEAGAHGEAAETGPNAVERYAAMHHWTRAIDVNIEGDGGRLLAMQLEFSLVYSEHELDQILATEVVEQRLRTSFVEFLRTLRAEDIYGSMGTFRIRAELRRRANLELAPHRIEDVLIPELIIA